MLFSWRKIRRIEKLKRYFNELPLSHQRTKWPRVILKKIMSGDKMQLSATTCNERRRKSPTKQKFFFGSTPSIMQSLKILKEMAKSASSLSSSSTKATLQVGRASSENSPTSSQRRTLQKQKSASPSTSMTYFQHTRQVPQKAVSPIPSLSFTGGRRTCAVKSSSADTTDRISPSAQTIISFCMENARADLATRIFRRMTYKRNDFSQFYKSLSSEQIFELINALSNFLKSIAKAVYNVDKVNELSFNFGANFVQRRSWGFKADYFAVMADALITECIFLDEAIHQPTETILAWVSLAELMFRNVRDGYYQQLRHLRKNEHCFNSLFAYSSEKSISVESESGNGNRRGRDETRPRNVLEHANRRNASSTKPTSSVDKICINNKKSEYIISRRVHSVN